MANRLVRIACVVVVAGLTAFSAQGCIYGKKSGPGTNLGSGLNGEPELPPPGQPTLTLREQER